MKLIIKYVDLKKYNFGLGAYIPPINTILIEKTLSKKQKREVLKHEMKHFEIDKKFNKYFYSNREAYFRLTKYGLKHWWLDIKDHFKLSIIKLNKNVK